jgi:hypothetical protein
LQKGEAVRMPILIEMLHEKKIITECFGKYFDIGVLALI